MTKIYTLTLFTFIFIHSYGLVAQGPPSGGRRPPGPPPGMDPSEMFEREKQMILENVEGITEDQELLIDGIYEEYATSFTEIMKEARENRSFEEMRTKREALREEKDLLLKDVLSESQYATYQGLIGERDAKRKQRQEKKKTQALRKDNRYEKRFQL
jgi:hypothetical protein